jgi:two-component system, cell cycle response regulator DivK
LAQIENTAVPFATPDRDGRPLVLIVDDNERNLKLARDVLRDGGYETLEATSGTEGVELATKHLPDVILLDLRLPDMEGVDVPRRLGAQQQTALIPVVALSSLPLEGGGDWLEDAGFAGYLEKPIDVAHFAEEVRGYCRRRKAM